MRVDANSREYEGYKPDRVGLFRGVLGRSVLKTVWNAPYNIRFFYKRNHIAPDPASKPDRKPAASEGKPAAPERAVVPERSAAKKKPVANRFAFLFDDDEWGCLLKKQSTPARKTRASYCRSRAGESGRCPWPPSPEWPSTTRWHHRKPSRRASLPALAAP